MYKRAYVAGIAGYIVLLVFSIVFYKERIIFLDTAFTIFHIVKDSFFSIQVYRFGDVFTQLLPVLCARAGLSLDTLVMSYSVGFVLYYFACYLVCSSWLKQYDLALVVLLLNLLFVTDGFYWITSQLPQGLALLLVMLAALRRLPADDVPPLRAAVIVALVITLAFFHPLLSIAMLYALLFWRWSGTGAARKLLSVIGTIFLLGIILKAIAFHTPYERSSMSGLRNFYRLFPDYFSLYANRQFLWHCLTRFCWIPLAAAGITVVYVRTRRWRLLWLFWLAFLGFLLLINVTYPNAATTTYYIESMYSLLGLIIGLPFVADVLPWLHVRKLALPAMIAIVLTGCIRIAWADGTYKARLAWERDFLARNPHIKMIANAQQANAGILQQLWGTPYEFWLLSTTEQGESASVIIDEEPHRRDWARKRNKTFIVNWDMYPYSTLNPRYFKFTDTVNGYTTNLLLK